jgi:hypothetical protein
VYELQRARKNLQPFLIGLTLAAIATAPGRLHAQEHMMAIVNSDRIVIGSNEFVPRRTDLSSHLIVPAGATVELDAASTFDYIEVSGTLRVSRTRNTTLTFTHLIVMPDGVLDVGTTADPIPCGVRVLFVVRNVPINTNIDPYQWGNGLVNFGRQSRVGCRKTAFLSTVGSLAKGATSITLSSAPEGWQAGDELLIPDTAQPAPSNNGTLAPARREKTVKVAAVSGSVVTVSKGLDFDHNDLTDPNGIALLHPRVANLTRNIVIQSEDQFGTRGHTVDIGMGASWNIQYNQLLGLGRTRAIALDSTVLPHIGSNQIGKYAEHHHHVDSAVGSVDIGNVYQGNPNTTKWAISVHGTSDALVQDCIEVDFPGAGFVTEDGSEVRNVFRHNLAAYSVGNHNGQDNVELVDFQTACPGCAGNGFWLHGIRNTFVGNEAWNNAIGVNLFNQTLVGSYPSAPGGMPDTNVNQFTAVPIAFASNIAASNLFDGIEHWGVPRFAATNFIAAYNGIFQGSFPISDDGRPYFVDSIFMGSNGRSACLQSSVGYTPSLELQGGRVVGCAIGERGGAVDVRFVGTTFQNVVDINWGSTAQPVTSYQENVVHTRMPGKPARFIVFGSDIVWNGRLPLPTGGASSWRSSKGSSHLIKNWQGTGQDIRLVQMQQIASNPAWPSQGPVPEGYAEWNCRGGGLTMGDCWSQYGHALGGEAVDSSQLLNLEGLFTFSPSNTSINLYTGDVVGLVPFSGAVAGLKPVLGPPRAILTWPNDQASAQIVNGILPMYAVLTGDYTVASDAMLVSIDGGAPFTVGQNGRDDARQFSTTAVASGVHSVRTWRTDAAGRPIDASLMTFQYSVTGASNIVPSVVGLTQDAAGGVLGRSGLVVGIVTMEASATVSNGAVIRQNPPSGVALVAGGSVNLVISSGPPPPPPPPPPRKCTGTNKSSCS